MPFNVRYLYDEAVKDERGYSVLILSASTAQGAANLQNINYPVYQRLGFEGPTRIQLIPIENAAEAEQFAHAYLEFEHSRWKEARKAPARSKNPYQLLPKGEIIEVYHSIAGADGVQGRRKISQAALLDVLHRAVEEKRAANDGTS